MVDFLKKHPEKVVLVAEEVNLEVHLLELAELVVFHQKDQRDVLKELQIEHQEVQKVHQILQEREDLEEVN